jgi:hypothetical protein
MKSIIEDLAHTEFSTTVRKKGVKRVQGNFKFGCNYIWQVNPNGKSVD